MTKPTSLLEFLQSTPVSLKQETVHIEEWGRDIVLQAWTSQDRDAFEEASLKRAQARTGNGTRRGQQTLQADLKNFRARLVARTIVEDGAHPFASDKGEELLGAQSASIIDRLFTVAQRLHGMSNEDVETLLGNASSGSEEIIGDDSSSSLPAH